MYSFSKCKVRKLQQFIAAGNASSTSLRIARSELLAKLQFLSLITDFLQLFLYIISGGLYLDGLYILGFLFFLTSLR